MHQKFSGTSFQSRIMFYANCGNVSAICELFPDYLQINREQNYICVCVLALVVGVENPVAISVYPGFSGFYDPQIPRSTERTIAFRLWWLGWKIQWQILSPCLPPASSGGHSLSVCKPLKGGISGELGKEQAEAAYLLEELCTFGPFGKYKCKV